MPALPLSQPAGSTNRFFYSGALGAAGANQNVDFDLTGLVTPGSAKMSAAVRSEPTFRDNWIVLARQVDAGLTAIDAEVEFLPAAPAVPTTLRLNVDALAIGNAANIEFIYEHSAVR